MKTKATTEKVILKTENLGSLFQLNSTEISQEKFSLCIPPYQRIYCWEEKNVIQLLDDILNYSEKTYHLGNIILHKKQIDTTIKYDVVDGQQRLVTLSLLLLEIKTDINLKFLEEIFESDEAREYIAYNKFLIKNYAENNSSIRQKISNILNHLQFSVLIIEEGSLDLAYTFFSNQNSRGKPLSDYALLKAHHLRFIYIPEQAEHLAKRWDSILLDDGNDESTELLNKTFDKYLFRLRKWIRKKEWSNDEQYKVKTEFEAAPIIKEIPPFGEQFFFNESIQGGTHFFAYADHFIYKFKSFSKTLEFELLEKYLSQDNHWWYRDIAEAFLFAYYLKFGSIYLEEALNGILKVISNHRYSNTRVYLRTVLRFAGESEIAMMIDQATSPTFFLAELQNIGKTIGKNNNGGTRGRYENGIKNIIDRK